MTDNPTAEEQDLKPLEIKNALIKETQCNYGYELLTGKTKGDVVNRKGAHLVHEDLEDAFKELDVFIAHIDGAFVSFANNQTPIQELEEKEELSKYHVFGFKFSGSEENKAVIFQGEKYTPHGTISFNTPKIKLENTTYLYADDLQLRLNNCIEEVELYMDGKAAPQLEQMHMDFASEDDAFEKGKVE
jgi:hypothetical protein